MRRYAIVVHQMSNRGVDMLSLRIRCLTDESICYRYTSVVYRLNYDDDGLNKDIRCPTDESLCYPYTSDVHRLNYDDDSHNKGTPELKDTPLGIGELKTLQTLSKIVIGGENDFSVNQLKDLNNLQGEISFKGLDKVLNIMEARVASLSLNRITVLKVEWDDESDDGSREQIARKEVLDALKPYEYTLKKLVIVNYLGLGFPKWVGDPPFCQLARVSIRGYKKYTSLSPLGKL
nr:NB-ARC domains-containing protein [Tanacetum cinerariifolium]